MQLSAKTHKGAEKTGVEMKRIIKAYSFDIGDLSNMHVIPFFNFVKKIPYRNDKSIFSDSSEIVARPKHLLNKRIYPRLDCKKKAILICSYLKNNGRKWRLLACSEEPDKHIHHVFPQGVFWGKWVNLDATYPEYRPGAGKNLTYAKEL